MGTEGRLIHKIRGEVILKRYYLFRKTKNRTLDHEFFLTYLERKKEV